MTLWDFILHYLVVIKGTSFQII